jgi:predicted nucleic acid-binding protein
MRRYLDTSILVRLLTGEPEDLAQRASALLRSGEMLWLTESALLETAHVLEKEYGNPRDAVVGALIALIREPYVQLHGLEYHALLQALLFCRGSRRVSFGDAFLWAAAFADRGEVYSFDRRFPRDQVPVLEPGPVDPSP